MAIVVNGRKGINAQVKMNKNFQHKLVNIFLLIILAYVLGAQKNCLIEEC